MGRSVSSDCVVDELPAEVLCGETWLYVNKDFITLGS